jgi:RNA polymerase sigma-70 factor (ECF subfamily)
MSQPPQLGRSLVARLYEQSGAARWDLAVERFQAAIEASVAHAFAGKSPAPPEVDRYVASLHLEDLALACACAAGQESAWNHFMLEHRPGLYRAADAIDPAGGARDLADSLYADLFGLREHSGIRQSLFRYFHGRSSLATWLRAVLSQRHIDRLRAGSRLDPLPDDDSTMIGQTSSGAPDPERPRFVAVMRDALAAAVAALTPRDRLRLGCYYAQDLTLAAIGRLLGEHEATVSRHLTRTRRTIREAVERSLRQQHGLDDPALAECFRSVVDDAGPLNLADMIGAVPAQEPRRGSFK